MAAGERRTFNGQFGGRDGLPEDALDVVRLVARVTRHVDAESVLEVLVQNLVLGACNWNNSVRCCGHRRVNSFPDVRCKLGS